jgi:hypothetical protein
MVTLWLALLFSPASPAASGCPSFAGQYERTADELGGGAKLQILQVGCELLELDYVFSADGTATHVNMPLDGRERTITEDEFVRERESYRWDGAEVLQELVLTLKYDGDREVRIETRYGLGEGGAFVERGRDLDADGQPGEGYEVRYERVGFNLGAE